MAARGDCYEANGRHMMGLEDDKGWELIHGVAVGQESSDVWGLEFGHCWLEHGGVVHDFSNGRSIKMPKEIYYIIGHINPKRQRRYNKDKMLLQLAKHKHWGPWDSKMIVEPTAADRKNEEARMKRLLGIDDTEHPMFKIKMKKKGKP